MGRHQWTDEQIAEAFAKFGTNTKAAKALGMPRTTFNDRIQRVPDEIVDAALRQFSPEIPPAIVPDTIDQEHRLEREAKVLRSRNKELEQQIAEDRETAKLLKSLEPHVKIPRWLTPKQRKKDRATACVMLSDLHYGETVNPHEIGGVNAYNLDIAAQRTKECFDNIVRLTRDHIGGVDYSGCVVFLGGDIVSGRIHDELRRTNEPESILEQSMFATNVLGAGLKQLLEHFGAVHVACVVGNHGRMDRQFSFKGYAKDSFDRLIYSQLRKELPEATFQIPEGLDCLVTVNESDYLLTHGNQFRGGTGISGIMTPLKLGAARKRQNQDFDYLVLGHFHQRMDTGDILVNGSLKGADEYSLGCNFPTEPPQQSFWLDQPGYGKTISAPIHCKSEQEDWSVFRESLL